MRRSNLTLAAASMLLLLLTALPGAAAQDGPDLNVQCVSISGEPAEGAWDEFSLQDAIAGGAAELTVVGPGDDCVVPGEGAACMTVAGAAPTGSWSRDELVEAISSGRAQIVLLAPADECARVIAETVDPVGAPTLVPLEVLETDVVIGDFSSSFVAIVSNPNTEAWAAQGLPLAVRVLDEAGTELESTSGFVTLLPGQTSTVAGFLATTGKPHVVEVVPEGADFDWLPTELGADMLGISGVKRKKDSVMGFVTTGKIRNPGDAPLDGVSVYAVHRNKAGDIIGADFTLLESIPAGEKVAFEIPNVSGAGRNKVAETEIYYQLSSVR